MTKIKTLKALKDRVQAGFDRNEDTLEQNEEIHPTQLKAYLIESNTPIVDVHSPGGKWEPLDADNWYTNKGGKFSNNFFLDTSRERIWIAYSIMDAMQTDKVIDSWINDTAGLDKCWLSRTHLLNWENRNYWNHRGFGFRFSDGLFSKDEKGDFSLKTWYRSNRQIAGLNEIIELASKNFAMYSTRWDKKIDESVLISCELYSNGKITINRSSDVDESLLTIGELANRYHDSIVEATDLRDESYGAFELDFAQEIDLDAFTNVVSQATGEMRLWLVETEAESDYRRYKGVDLHTGDRILLNLGSDYAHVTVPGKGCVNAVPRIAVIQGENIGGNTSIYHDGVELFA